MALVTGNPKFYFNLTTKFGIPSLQHSNHLFPMLSVMCNCQYWTGKNASFISNICQIMILLYIQERFSKLTYIVLANNIIYLFLGSITVMWRWEYREPLIWSQFSARLCGAHTCSFDQHILARSRLVKRLKLFILTYLLLIYDLFVCF